MKVIAYVGPRIRSRTEIRAARFEVRLLDWGGLWRPLPGRVVRRQGRTALCDAGASVSGFMVKPTGTGAKASGGEDRVPGMPGAPRGFAAG